MSGALPALVLVLWWGRGSWAPLERLFPVPLGDVLGALITLGAAGQILHHAALSLKTMGLGLFWAVAIALPLGMLMAWSRPVDDFVDPLVELTRPVPPLAMVPLALLWFGIGIASRVFMVAMMGFPVLLITTVAGVKNVPVPFLVSARSYGAGTSFIFRKVVLPAALPSLWTGFRLAIGRGFAVLVAAEMIAADSGLGWLVMQAWELRQLDLLLATMCVIAILALGLDVCLRTLLIRGPLAWLSHQESGS